MGLGEPNNVSIISNADAALAAVSVNDVVIHFSDAPYLRKLSPGPLHLRFLRLLRETQPLPRRTKQRRHVLRLRHGPPAREH